MSLNQHAGATPQDGAAGCPAPSDSIAEAVAEGLNQVRLEGLEPSAEALVLLESVAAGQVSITEALEQVLSAARAA